VTTSLNPPIRWSSRSSTGLLVHLAGREDHGDHALLLSQRPKLTRLMDGSAEAIGERSGTRSRLRAELGGRSARAGLCWPPGSRASSSR
jgi:hypothetical protein